LLLLLLLLLTFLLLVSLSLFSLDSFLVQFGISLDAALLQRWEERPSIPDDELAMKQGGLIGSALSQSLFT
jgi:hypothetical protein